MLMEPQPSEKFTEVYIFPIFPIHTAIAVLIVITASTRPALANFL